MFDLIPQDKFDRLPEQFRKRAREIDSRVKEIDQLLMPGEPAAIRAAGARLQGQLRPQPEINIEEYAQEFREACADIPEWALHEACNDFLAGRVDNHTGQYMPTCAEFARYARSIMAPFAGERVIIRREAKKLFIRAEDQRRRDIIAIERMDPNQKERIRKTIADANRGAAKPVLASPHTLLDSKTQAQLDALKIVRPEPASKIPQTKAGRSR